MRIKKLFRKKRLYRKKRHYGKNRLQRLSSRRGKAKRRVGRSSRKSKAKSKKSVRAIKLDGLIKSVSDQALLLNYGDLWTLQGSTNNAALATWVPTNATASGTISANSYPNLMIDDNTVLYNMFTAQYPVTASGVSPILQQLGNMRILRKSWETRMQLVNNETSKVCITEYRCVARQSYAESIAGMFTDMATLAANNVGAGVGSRLELNPYGLANPSIGAKSNGSWPVQYGVTPFMLHSFTQRFKIKKVKAHHLLPGRHKTIIYKSTKPRLFKYQQIFSSFERTDATNASANDVFGIRKGQAFSLFICNGTWASDSAANAGFQHGVSNVSIGSLVTIKVHFDIMSTTLPTSAVGNQVPGFTLGQNTVPLPVVANQPVSSISVGASAAGTRVWENTSTYLVNMIDGQQNTV